MKYSLYTSSNFTNCYCYITIGIYQLKLRNHSLSYKSFIINITRVTHKVTYVTDILFHLNYRHQCPSYVTDAPMKEVKGNIHRIKPNSGPSNDSRLLSDTAGQCPKERTCPPSTEDR